MQRTQKSRQNREPKTQNQNMGFVFAFFDSSPSALSGSSVFSVSVPSAKRAFTLIEIMVAITLFTIIMVSAVGSLIAINDANRKTQAVRSAIDNVNFALDNMSRRLRTGMNYDCLTSGEALIPLGSVEDPVSPKNCPQGEPAIAFTAAEFLGVGDGSGTTDMGQSGVLAGGTLAYRLGPEVEGRRAIESNTRPRGGSFAANYTPMTSPDVNIEELRFVVLGTETGDGKQPYVLITVRGSIETGKGSRVQKTTFRVQTTVSQRLMDRL